MHVQYHALSYKSCILSTSYTCAYCISCIDHRLRGAAVEEYSHIVLVGVYKMGCTAGFMEVLTAFTTVNFASFVTLYQSKNAQLFLISIFCYLNFCQFSNPVKRDPTLDQFSMIT